MKVIAIVENKIASGGGFNQALSAVLQMHKLCIDKFDFAVFTTGKDNLDIFSGLGIEAKLFSYSIFDRLLALFAANSWWHIIQGRLKFMGGFEKKLLKDGCDLVYFTNPGTIAPALQKLNYICTLWDLCQVQTPEFPEVRAYGEYFSRDLRYKNSISSAYLVLTDSKTLSGIAVSNFGISEDRFLAMPYSVPAHIGANQPDISSDHQFAEVINKYQLPTSFYFYPAQFWAHKNHIRLIQAVDILRKKNININLVFCGGDHGNRSYVEGVIKTAGLQNQIKVLGFVSMKNIQILYRLAHAIVMPTYFGPTNLPPLEAWSVGKPLIYSSLFEAEVGNAAILVDPDSAESVASGLVMAQDNSLCSEIVSNGKELLQKIAQERIMSEQLLVKKLEIFNSRLQTWKSE